jgi:hypothetical protein
MGSPLSDKELALIDAYWRAANYLSVGQIYLYDNPLLIPWRRPIASLNYLLSSHVWRQDHNGFSHQDPGFIDHVVNKKAEVVRVYLPPDANCLLSVTDHCLRSRNYVNVIVAGKQPAPQWLTIDEAIKHCTAGLGIWEWASNDRGAERTLPPHDSGVGVGERGRVARSCWGDCEISSWASAHQTGGHESVTLRYGPDGRARPEDESPRPRRTARSDLPRDHLVSAAQSADPRALRPSYPAGRPAAHQYASPRRVYEQTLAVCLRGDEPPRGI